MQQLLQALSTMNLSLVSSTIEQQLLELEILSLDEQAHEKLTRRLTPYTNTIPEHLRDREIL